MLQETLREQSAAAHQQLEKIVVARLKTIKSDADYANLLKYFYAYFSRLEQVIAPFITGDILPDQAQRRNSGYIANDIISLGQTLDQIPVPEVPQVNNLFHALGALYVMEGSVMGGPIIVQMLAKFGIVRGVSFFSGYGKDTSTMWNRFVEAMNKNVPASEEYQVVETAVDTFHRFTLSFNEK